MKVAQVVTKKVILYPLDPTTRKRDTVQPPYTFRLLEDRPDHTDYDDGMEMWVTNLTVQFEAIYPMEPNQWGEVHPLAPPTAPGTKAEFEDAIRAFLMLIGAAGGGRLQNHLSNFNIAKRLKAEKPTTIFAEHVLFDLIEEVERATGFTIFPVQINNTACGTKLYDCAHRNRLPSSPEVLPDQGKSFTGADGGVCKVSQVKVLQAATGDDGLAYLPIASPFKMSPHRQRLHM